MGTKKSFEYISETATKTTPSWTNTQVAQFNYFNPNGLLAKWNAMCDTVTQYADAGIVPNGWILAYGSLSSFAADNVRELGMERRVNGTKLYVSMKMLQDAIDKGYEKLGELHA